MISINNKYEVLSFAASYCDGANPLHRLGCLGGKLYINDDVAVFKPHSFNIGDCRDRIIPITHISGYKKGIAAWMYVFFDNGKTIQLSVWNKNAVINALETRRLSIYAKHERQAPTLVINPNL